MTETEAIVQLLKQRGYHVARDSAGRFHLSLVQRGYTERGKYELSFAGYEPDVEGLKDFYSNLISGEIAKCQQTT
jgi:hypothetical protein